MGPSSLEGQGQDGGMSDLQEDAANRPGVESRCSERASWHEQRRRETQISGWVRFLPSSAPSRLFLGLVLVETCVNLAIEADLLYRFDTAVKANGLDDLDNASKRTLPVYLCIFGVAHLFQLIMSVDAIYNRNTIQIIGLSIFNALFMGYAVVQMFEIQSSLGTDSQGREQTGETPNSVLHVPVSVLTGGILGMIALAEAGFIVLSWFIYKQYGWETYKDLGADRLIKRCYTRYQVFICIVRFSAFFIAGYGGQLVFMVLQKTDIEYYFTIVALLLSILPLVFGLLSARQEWLYGMLAFMAGLLGGSAYFFWKLHRMWTQQATIYAEVFKSLTTFACISLLMLVFMFISGAVITHNFNLGLKRQLDRSRQKRQNSRRGTQSTSKRSARRGSEFELAPDAKMQEQSEHELRAQHGRMSID